MTTGHETGSGRAANVPHKVGLLAKKIYDNVRVALWATLTAFVLWPIVFVVPNLTENLARAPPP